VPPLPGTSLAVCPHCTRLPLQLMAGCGHINKHTNKRTNQAINTTDGNISWWRYKCFQLTALGCPKVSKKTFWGLLNCYIQQAGSPTVSKVLKAIKQNSPKAKQKTATKKQTTTN